MYKIVSNAGREKKIKANFKDAKVAFSANLVNWEKARKQIYEPRWADSER